MERDPTALPISPLPGRDRANSKTAEESDIYYALPNPSVCAWGFLSENSRDFQHRLPATPKFVFSIEVYMGSTLTNHCKHLPQRGMS